MHSRPRLLTAAIGVVTIVATAAGCATPPTTTQPTGSEPVAPDAQTTAAEAPVPLVGSISGQLAESYRTLAGLSTSATHIVVASVVATTSKPHEGLAFTEATVAVRETLKGTSVSGERLRVLETGGLLPPGPAKGSRDPVAASPPPTPPAAQEVGFEGVPVMRPGRTYLLFLGGYTGPIAEPGALRVLGVVQGKLRVDPAGFIRFEGPEAELTSPMFRTVAAAHGRALADVLAEVRTALR